MPIRESREGYLETIPELVVEIRSKNDSSAEINQKIAEYLASRRKGCVDRRTAIEDGHRTSSRLRSADLLGHRHA